MPILTAELAQDIVSRTMRIIPFNVNVMDAKARFWAAATLAGWASCTTARCWRWHSGARWR